MTSRPGSLVFCLFAMFFVQSQGLQFSMNTSLDNSVCGHLKCWVDTSQSDDRILFMSGLTIYDITRPNSPLKLASVSAFDTSLYVDQTNINIVNATGTISKFHAELTLSMNDTIYCLNTIFMCELDFANATKDPDVIQETVCAEQTLQCYACQKDLAEKDKKIVALETELSRLKAIVDENTRTCTKGLPHNNTREKFILWNQVPALCDTETDGGGWVVIQRRTKGDVDFYRGWDDYKKGFGTRDSDFWIGNEVIHNLTLHGYTELRIDMEYGGRQYFAHYAHFTVDDEALNYRLNVSGYDGTAKDGLTYSSGKGYSTYDKDNDGDKDRNWASYCHGGWWFGYFDTYSNLNGQWGGRADDGVWWSSSSYSVTLSEMKVRRV